MRMQAALEAAATVRVISVCFGMLRRHCATMTDTCFLMLLRHAGSCGERVLVTAHHAPSGAVTHRAHATISAQPDVAPLVVLGLRLPYRLPSRLMHGPALRLRTYVHRMPHLSRLVLRLLLLVPLPLRGLLRGKLLHEPRGRWCRGRRRGLCCGCGCPAAGLVVVLVRRRRHCCLGARTSMPCLSF